MSGESFEQAQQSLKDDFDLFDSWRDKIEYIIDLGKNLPGMAEELKIDGNKVRGCQSQVWLTTAVDPSTKKLLIQADSDAFIVRGLIAILLRIYDQRSPGEITGKPLTLFDDIGLSNHLTPGRSNGLYAMIARIRALAMTHQAGD